MSNSVYVEIQDSKCLYKFIILAQSSELHQNSYKPYIMN